MLRSMDVDRSDLMSVWLPRIEKENHIELYVGRGRKRFALEFRFEAPTGTSIEPDQEAFIAVDAYSAHSSHTNHVHLLFASGLQLHKDQLRLEYRPTSLEAHEELQRKLDPYGTCTHTNEQYGAAKGLFQAMGWHLKSSNRIGLRPFGQSIATGRAFTWKFNAGGSAGGQSLKPTVASTDHLHLRLPSSMRLKIILILFCFNSPAKRQPVSCSPGGCRRRRGGKRSPEWRKNCFV